MTTPHMEPAVRTQILRSVGDATTCLLLLSKKLRPMVTRQMMQRSPRKDEGYQHVLNQHESCWSIGHGAHGREA
jgi:hypothetical protein